MSFALRVPFRVRVFRETKQNELSGGKGGKKKADSRTECNTLVPVCSTAIQDGILYGAVCCAAFLSTVTQQNTPLHSGKMFRKEKSGGEMCLVVQFVGTKNSCWRPSLPKFRAGVA